MKMEYFLEKVDEWIRTKENGTLIETLQMQKEAISADFKGSSMVHTEIYELC